MSSNLPPGSHPDGILFIVSGPSGAGKTSLIEKVRRDLALRGHPLHFSVSHTTREPRTNEVDGRSYHFVDEEIFTQMAEREEFIEWAHVHGQMYGTSRREVLQRLERGEDVILDIDVQGARIISRDEGLRPHSLSVFVFPPSFEELERRLRSRGLNSEEDILRRLEKASDEIEDGLNFYDYVIINDDLDIAAEALKAAIIARKMNTKSSIARLREMSRSFKEDRSAAAEGNRK
ncbi:MAG: guanylate kinase [Thermoanaerobaculia bacterium]|nr:guanylate kinase [Thermoanaerobaculia bacterium]